MRTHLSEKIIIIGASGFGMEVLWLAKRCGYSVIGFLDDTEEKWGTEVLGHRVLGPITSWTKYQNSAKFIIAVGSPRARKHIFDKMNKDESMVPKYATLVDPSAIVDDNVKIGEGSVVCAGSIFTVKIELGAHVIVNLNVTVGHETRIGDFVTIAPMTAISGNVTINDYVEVGTGSAIREKCTIDQGSMVGMGGVLVKDVGENVVVVGNPAKPLER